MRTTVTLDPDTAAMVQRLMRERGMSFKEAVNHAIRVGLAPVRSSGAASTPAYSLGEPAVSLDKALRLAGDLEDAELAHRLALRK